jgi:hypothetical protein
MSHESTYNDVIKKRQSDPELIPVTISTIPQIRMTRKITGEYVLSDKEMHKYFEDSIGMVSNLKKGVQYTKFRSEHYIVQRLKT